MIHFASTRFKKSLCVLLVLSMLVSIAGIFPTYANEKNDIPDDFVVDVSGADLKKEKDSLDIAYEENTLRTEDSKTFAQKDGTFVVASYDEPVHYKNSEGKLVDINNRLTLVNSAYQNKDNLVKMSLGEKSFVEKNGYTLSWKLIDAKESKPEILENKKTDNPLELPNLTSKLTYKNVYENTDFEYILHSTNLKENILINGKKEDYNFSFFYESEKLTLKQLKDGSIASVNEKHETIFSIPKPFMYDANEEYSDDVSYKLERIDNGYILTIVPSEKWINDGSRKFPVTIDPSIESNDFGNDSVTIGSGTYHDSEYLTYQSGFKRTIGKYKYLGVIQNVCSVELPEVPDSWVVQKAELEIYQKIKSIPDGTEANVKRVNLTAAEKTFGTTNRTWDWYYSGLSSASVEREIIDYTYASEELTNVKYDITELARKWSTGELENNGVMLSYDKQFEGEDETDALISFYPSIYAGATSKPKLIVTYADNSGLSSFNSYKQISIENAGTLYINEYTGKLIYTQEEYSMPGNRNQCTVSHIYNQDKRDENIGYGYGFNISNNARIEELPDNCPERNLGYEFKYFCEDGKAFLFKYDAENEKYICVENWMYFEYTSRAYDSITVTFSDGHNEIFTQNGNEPVFFRTYYGSNGTSGQLMIGRESDSTISFIKNASASVSGTIYFDMQNNSLLRICFNNSHCIATFEYANGYLHTINQNDSTTTFTYTSDGKLASVSNNWETYYITYDSEERVATVAEGSPNNIILSCSYSFGRTEFIHQGTSYDVTADDAIREVCVFNNYGQKETNYITSKDGSEYYGVTNSKYSDTNRGALAGESELNNNNKLISQSTSYDVTNLLDDPSNERRTWAQNTVGETDDCYVGSSGGSAYVGERMLEVTADEEPVATDVYAYKNVGVFAPGSYTFSAYVKEFELEGTGAFLSVNGEEYVLHTSIGDKINKGWERISVTVDVESESAVLNLKLGIKAGTMGTAYFDCMQLERNETANVYNMFGNSSFESNQSWIAVNCIPSYTTEEHFSGLKSLKISGNEEQAAKVYQVVDISTLDFRYNESYTYILDAWAKASSCDLSEKTGTFGGTTTAANPSFAVAVACLYDDATSEIIDSQSFDASITDWQNTSLSFAVSKNENGAFPIRLFIYCLYEYNVNDAYFDCFCLKSSGTYAAGTDETTGSDEYGFTLVGDNQKDGYGNSLGSTIYDKVVESPSAITNNSKYYLRINQTDFFADKNSNNFFKGGADQEFLFESIDQNEYVIKNGSDNKCLEVSNSTIELNDYSGSDSQKWLVGAGTETNSIIIRPKNDTTKAITADMEIGTEAAEFLPYFAINADDVTHMSTSETYTSDGQFMTSSTDERGMVTEYSFDAATGNINYYINPGNTKYIYTYENGKPKQVFADLDGIGENEDQNNPFVLYTYDGSRITSVQNTADEFNYEYLPNGNTSAIKAGDNSLISYTYENNGYGNIKRVTYANGQYYEYTYDSKGNVTRVDFVNGTESHYYTYSYDNAGNVLEMYDSANDVRTVCKTNLTGNVYGTVTSDGKEIHEALGTSGRSTKLCYNWNGQIKEYTINYKDETMSEIESVTAVDETVISRETDGFDRIVSKNLQKDSLSMHETYSYISNPTDNTTTNFVSEMTMTDGVVHKYSYTNNGQISAVYRNDETAPLMSFCYDQLGRLIQENRRDLSKSYFYGYDDAGNQTYTWEYGYTSTFGIPAENPIAIKNFGYSAIATGMTALTSFGGGTITYDNAGNPLQYYNGMNFSWQDGRQLKSISNTNLNLNFKYDASGMRTEKTGNVNGATVNTKYFYDGTSLVAYQEGNNKIWFLKDEAGELVGFTYDHHSYFYIKNLQGDVLGILDEIGNTVVNYCYNAWGKPESMTGNITLGELNPIRYRSYVYDNETGFYYLCSRYYDPSTGRFLNADLAEYLGVTGTLMSYNLYSYCEGDPINKKDPDGSLVIEQIQAWRPIIDTITLMVTTAFALSMAMYCVAIYNKIAYGNVPIMGMYYDFSFKLANVGNLMFYRLLYSTVMRDIVRECADKGLKRGTVNFSSASNPIDMDLFLAIGKATYKIRAFKEVIFHSIFGDFCKYTVELTLGDVYDFHEDANSGPIVNAVNYIAGWLAQGVILKPYRWMYHVIYAFYGG